MIFSSGSARNCHQVPSLSSATIQAIQVTSDKPRLGWMVYSWVCLIRYLCINIGTVYTYITYIICYLYCMYCMYYVCVCENCIPCRRKGGSAIQVKFTWISASIKSDCKPKWFALNRNCGIVLCQSIRVDVL